MQTDRARRIAQEFDAKAASYEEGRLGAWYRAQGDQVLAALGPSAAGVLLDVGCATGSLLRRAVAARPGLTGVGYDLSPGMVRRARDEAADLPPDRLRFEVADWEDGPPALPPVDWVTCVSTFHYFADPQRALERFREALVLGGTLLLLDRARERSGVARAWDLLHRYVIRDSCRFFGTAEILAMAGRAGFREATVLRHTDRWFWKGKLHTSLVLVSARK